MVDFVLGRLRFKFKGDWATSTAYIRDDVITYGGRSYVCLTNHTSDSSASGGFYTDASNWELMTDGVEYKGNWAGSTYYKLNDIVKKGGSIFVCNTGHTSNTNWEVTSSNFTLLVDGLKVQSDYDAATKYTHGDVVRYGGYTYTALSDTIGNAPDNNTYWRLLVRGNKHNGVYNSGTTYQLGDTVSWNGSSWIANTNNVVGITPQPSANAYWNIYAQGTANVLTTTGDTLYQSTNGYERLPIGANGQVLAVYAGIPRWEDNSYANNVFYVSPTGTDDPAFGKTLQRPFKTIKYATGHVANTAGAGTRTTIFVKDGVYAEQLPITVPANTAIMGDSQRTVVVSPAAGFDDTGSTFNTQSTMWYVSDGVLLKQMTFTGMTGFTAGSPDDDITLATVGGVFVRFNPSSPIATKSPYILECSAISNGGIGVIVDGSVHASGYKSMVFHAYTNLNNDGVGYWVKDNGRAEIVSCFSYYCWFGIATSGGGFVRGLNNNNSYGRYGAVSRGFDTGESVLTGKIYGQQLAFSAGSTMAFNVGEFITGGTSSANGLITNVQAAANKLYYWPISGTFQNSEVVTGVSTAVTATTTSSGVTGQKGYVLIANGFSSEPKPGRSIQINGDSDAYVIQSVSGTYSSSNSQMVLVLAQEKTTPSANAQTVTIRQNFSQIRLTGHDFLDIGTGNTVTANIPGVPSLPVTQANEVVEYKPGRVYYVSTDQNGNFRVGEYFKIDQATGRATLDASAFDLSGLTSLKLGSIGAQLGETINEFSSDVTLGGDSNQAVPTEHAVKYYTDNKFVQLTAASQTITGNVIVSGNLTIVGGATQISANNLVVGDSLIYLAANNYSGTDALDIGFIGNYGNATSANVHTGLIRDASNKQYYLFQGYDAEPANNTFVPGGNNMTNAVLVADLNTSNLTLGGANAITWIKTTFDTTNAAFGVANSSLTVIGDTNAALPNTANVYAYYRTGLFSPSAAGEITWNVTGLPSGVTSSYSSGTLTLTASSSAAIGNSNIVITATSGSVSATKNVALRISDVYPYYPNTAPSGTQYLGESQVSTHYFAGAKTTGGTVPTHTIIDGSLPSWATLNSANGAITGTTLSQNTTPATYTFTVRAAAGGFNVDKKFIWSIAYYNIQGQALYGTNVGAGTYSWTAPAGVTSVSVVAVGGGGGGIDSWANPAGSGGGLGWKNNIPVTPGQSYTVVVGAAGSGSSAGSSAGGTSYFNSTSTVAGYGGGNASGYSTSGPNSNSTYGGGYYGDGGGAGGYAPNYGGGGGAGGYTARGGNAQGPAPSPGGGGAGGGYYSSTYGTGAGGGVGLNGMGPSGTTVYLPWTGYGTTWGYGGGGAGGSGGENGYYGENPFGSTAQSSSNIKGGDYGGGGGGPGTSWPNASGNGGQGGVRIIWGPNRAFPDTNTADVPTQAIP